MKKLLILSLIYVTFVSFTSNNDNDDPVELIGTWRLIEQYTDPGDGSGDYMPVDSDKTITFNANRSVNSNGDLCSMSTTVEESSTGTYDITQGKIILNDCYTTEYTLNFEMKDDRLFLYYPCIEGCGQKFRKTN